MADDAKDDTKVEYGDSFKTAAWDVPDRASTSPGENTFELGLVMAGAVSAGAYTAGVIDYIVEALDTWEKAKAEGRTDVPQHSVRVRVVSGASAGAMTAAILAAHAYRAFPHVRPAETYDAKATGKALEQAEEENPFFNAWVRRIDIKELLKTGKDCGPFPPSSLFDGAILDDIVKEVLDSAGSVTRHDEKTITLRKSWLEEPTRFILTVGNLRGTPYWQHIQGVADVGYGMNTGRDYQTFALMPPASTVTWFNDEIPLMAGAVGSNLDTWKALGQWGLASGAFPVGLPPRELVHGKQDLRYRVVTESDDPGAGRYAAAIPSIDWPAQKPRQDTDDAEGTSRVYDFIAVDGGTLNNEPLNLAREVLAGGAGRNPREGNKATRAVVLIDPFPEFAPPAAPEEGDMALWKVVPTMMDMWKGTARFNVEDLVLSNLEEVYSRFQIAPSRDSPSPKAKSLACGVLGGFGGFLNEAYRRHDYYLGRRNAQRMLRQYLVLPEDNKLFEHNKKTDPALDTAKFTAHYPNESKKYYSIIPIVPDTPIDMPEPEPDWPQAGLVREYGLSLLFADRLSEVAKCSLKTSGLSGFRVFFLSLLVSQVVKSKVGPMVQKYLKDALDEWGL